MKRPHKRSFPCPVCGGFDEMPRGKDIRCFGFTSEDLAWTRCTREELRGSAPYDEDSRAYVHKMQGPCMCGITHAEGDNGMQAAPAIQQERKRVKEYIYQDSQGRALYRVVRWDPKSFSQERYDAEKDSWTSGAGCMADVPRVPYCLPDLLAADPDTPILILEGEKDVQAASTLGFVATTNSGGAGKWSPDHHARYLAGRHVIIIPDEDDAGLDHAQKVASTLEGVAKSVKTARLKDRAKDLSEWVEKGATREDLEKLISCRLDIPPPLSAEALLLQELPPIDYVIQPLMSIGNLTQLQGEPKAGKSAFGLYLAICGAIGIWPSGRFSAPKPRRTLFVTWEDGLRRVKTRLRMYLEGLGFPDPPSNLDIYCHSTAPKIRLETPQGRDMLHQIIGEGQYEAVYLDTLSHLHACEENSKQEMQPVVDALKDACSDLKCSICAFHHASKPSKDGRSKVYRGRGSSVIAAAADIIIDFGDRGESNATPCQLISKDDDADSWNVIYSPSDESVKWTIEDIIEGSSATDTKALVLDAVKQMQLTSPEGVTARMLEDIGIQYDTARRTLMSLLSDGKVSLSTGPNRKKLFKVT